MTSRTEYRLLHRQDNADQRLTEIGCRLGLVPPEQLEAVRKKYAAVERECKRLEHTGAAPSPELDAFLAAYGETSVANGARLADLLRRPPISYEALAPFDPDRPELPKPVREAVEIAIKYQGYIDRQLRQVEEMKKLEDRRLPDKIDYTAIEGLRLEAAEAEPHPAQKPRPGQPGVRSFPGGCGGADGVFEAEGRKVEFFYYGGFRRLPILKPPPGGRWLAVRPDG